ncbi:hypothetical protein VTJ49DRAFT_182 [Mycothermus thermophilus]|uniref:Alkaline phytoceramidase n=1 Tax=Humicola insolens TaxID=85995 RepID=A0ABR3VGC2_HUMIN
MGLVSALQIPYRESREGFWGDQTSTLNWCEEDYNISFYCAEVVNTLTNLVFMWLGLRGLRDVISFGHSRVFILVFLGYMVVGLGSMAFHTTLKYEMQLADELPMIYTVCIMAFATFGYKRAPKVQALIATGLVGLAVFITVYYLYAQDPVFHQVAYGLLTLSTVCRGFYVMERHVRPRLKQRNPAEVEWYMRNMYKLAVSGIGMFLAGFFIWNIDNIFCHHLTASKNRILLPWSVLLEGHGWWHILTGLAYHMILWRVWLNRCLDGKETEFMLDWVPLRSVPRVVPRVGGAVQGNGFRKTQARLILNPGIPNPPGQHLSRKNTVTQPKMSISNEALQKLVREIESQAVAAQQQISLVRTQVAAKQREMRLAQLTRNEIAALPADTAVYEGVGKMFVAVPVPAMQDKLGSQIKEIEAEVDGLGKRLHYLETTAKNSQEHIKKMLKGGSQ